MDRYQVSSSNIVSVGYDPHSETLEIEFLNGAVYQYYGVSENLYQQLIQESSVGRFFSTYIKNSYPYSRV